MQIINTLLDREMVEALGWTVLHSLWQAAVVAVGLAFFLLIGREKTARLRYIWANIALLLVVGLAIVTFVGLYEQQSAQLQPAPPLEGQLLQEGGLAADNAAGAYSFTQRFVAYFDEHLPLIVSLWLAGLCLFLLRLLGGLVYVQRLKHSQVRVLDTEWQDMLGRLSQKMGLRTPVLLLESALARSPMVIGHVKPCLLFPIGAVNQLTPEQVEAVLAHELAHIFRNDYLWNIVQSAIEILMYFNPAVWWISAVIRDERESSCDDVAVAVCGNSLTYARALVSLQEMQQWAPAYAMAFSGKKRRMLYRIQRILKQPQNKSNTMEKLIVTCLLLLLVGGLSIGARQPEFSAADRKNADAVLIDSLPDGKIRLNLKHKGKQVEARLNEGAVTYLKVDGEEIPAKDYAKYEEMLGDILEDMPVPPGSPSPVAPPAPPVPPAPPMPGVPAAPTPPNAPDFPAIAPFWNDNMAIRSFKNFNTSKDDKGNTLIEIEGLEGGKIMKLEIDGKTGVVLLDGAPLEDGRTAVISDLGEFPMAFPNLQIHPHVKMADLERLRFNQGELAELLAEKGQLLRDQEQELLFRRHGMKQLNESAMREALIAMEEAGADRREEFERLHRSANEMHHKALLERELAMAAPRIDGHIMGYFDKSGIVNNRLERILEAHLLEDGLINFKSGYKMELTGESLKVNGKKQPERTHSKYKRLYEEFSGLDLTKKSRIIIDTRKAE